jgi:hypothetical protein
MKRIGSTLAGVALLVVSAVGAVHGVRAAAAQATYYRAKYGSARDRPLRILEVCRAAHRLYPFNYYFCAWAVEQAYHSAFTLPVDQAAARFALAEQWCATGLGLNPHKTQLRLFEARLLERESLAEATAAWEAYVDWHFWDPFNHAVLVEFYSKAGDYGKALQALEWVRGSEYAARAGQILQEAWDREREMPPDLNAAR